MTSLPKIGYYLSAKKQRQIDFASFLTTYQSAAKLVAVNALNLEQEGPYDTLFLRFTDELANGAHTTGQEHPEVAAFKDYLLRHPTVRVVDPIAMQQNVVGRDLMKHCFQQLNAGLECINNPRSVICTLQLLASPAALSEEVTYPVICKPIQASGSTESHVMTVGWTRDSLVQELRRLGTAANEQLLLQEYVNHDATIFKIYYLNGHTAITSRISLPNFPLPTQAALTSGQPAPITFDSQEWKHSLPPHLTVAEAGCAAAPSQEVVTRISAFLANVLGLSLYGFDLLHNVDRGNYAVVDVNYLPDYRNVPDFHQLLFAHLVGQRV